MSLLVHIIVTYIEENIIIKLQKLYSPPRNPGADNKSPVLYVKKPLCTGNLSPARKIFIERPETGFYMTPSALNELRGVNSRLRSREPQVVRTWNFLWSEFLIKDAYDCCKLLSHVTCV